MYVWCWWLSGVQSEYNQRTLILTVFVELPKKFLLSCEDWLVHRTVAGTLSSGRFLVKAQKSVCVHSVSWFAVKRWRWSLFKHTLPNTRTEPLGSRGLWSAFLMLWRARFLSSKVCEQSCCLGCTGVHKPSAHISFTTFTLLELNLLNYSSFVHFVPPVTCRMKTSQAWITLSSHYFIANHHAIVILTSTINTTKQKTSASWWWVTCTPVRASTSSGTISSGSRELHSAQSIGRLLTVSKAIVTSEGLLSPFLCLHDDSGSSVRKGSARHLRIFTTTEAGGSLACPVLWLINFRYHFLCLTQDWDTRHQANSATRWTGSTLVRSCILINQSSCFLTSLSHSFSCRW